MTAASVNKTSSQYKIVLFVLLMWTTVANAQTTLEGLTFKDCLQACIEAIGSGDLQTAADLFQSLEQTFGAESEYQAEEAQIRILPLKGLAELGAGRFQQATNTLDQLAEAHPETIQSNPSLLYGWARAHKGAGNPAEARRALDFYIRRVAGSLEAQLAILEKAELFFVEGLLEDGIAVVDTFANSEAPDSLKMQGQLKAIQSSLDQGQWEQATSRMLDTKWFITTMPELAQLAFSALRCGENAIGRGLYAEALKLFQLVPPKSQLVRLQEEKLADLEQRILSGRRRALLATNRHQQQYLSRLQQQLQQQLDALQTSDDYTPTFFLQYGQCLLFDGQFYKAWLVFEYLSLNETYPSSVREEAHYRWVVTAHQLKDWEEALTIARNFVDRYPESQLAPQALYLIAKAHLEQRRYPESNVVLTDLIESFPDHSLNGRWLFTRGFNHVVLEAYEGARRDFSTYVENHPNGQLVINARLWNALSHFFERNYSTCITELSELQTLDARHPLYPEILYRLSSAYYSAREYQSALTTIEDYLNRFSRHMRIDEAKVLKGDILMGEGRLEEATKSFDSVSVESPDMYLYSLFQRGKIYRAQEDYQGMIQLFDGFLKDEKSPKIRISEALYWLGWAYHQDGKTELAYPLFESALNEYGNDPQAAETQSILQALERIKRRDNPDYFANWLEEESRTAKNSNRLTYLSRLILYQHNRSPNDDEIANNLAGLADLVPLEQMDPEALGKVGLSLLNQEDERAEDFFTYLVENYPKSNARAMGHLGLASLAHQDEEWGVAKDWLVKSEKEVPMHPHMNETQLLLGQVLSRLNEFDSSIETFEKLLRLKSARGRPHAQALSGIAQAHLGKKDREKAIAYYQRVFNMYRAYPDLVSHAYLESAELFESMNRIPEAVRTLQEMLEQSTLAGLPEWDPAQAKLKTLLPLMPEEEENVISEESNETPG